MKKKFQILLGVNILIAFILIFILPEFLESHIGHVVMATGIGISIILIEIPICFMILSSNKDADN